MIGREKRVGGRLSFLARIDFKNERMKMVEISHMRKRMK